MDFFLSFTEKKYYYILSTSHIRSFCFGVVTLLGVLTDRATNLCEGGFVFIPCCCLISRVMSNWLTSSEACQIFVCANQNTSGLAGRYFF